MRLEQLSQIIEIADTGSFSEAARRLFISQPSLSRSVKQFEEELGYELFERTRSGVVLTERGKLVLERARTVERECQHLTDELITGESPARPTLRTASLYCRVTSRLPFPITRYDGQPVMLHYHNSTSLDEIIGLISTLQVDYATICVLSPFIKEMKIRLKNLDIEYHEVSRSAIYAAVGPASPLYGAEKTSRAEILGQTVICFADYSGDLMCNFAEALGIAAQARGLIKTNNPKIFYQAIHETSALGLIAVPPEIFPEMCEYSDIRLIPIEDSEIYAEYAWIKLRRVELGKFVIEETASRESVF